MIRWVCRLLVVTWASPWTALGILLGLAGLATGGRGRIRSGVLEFHGGLLTRMLDRLPVSAIAMTLGHVVVGQTASGLDLAREHELVHVRQYERWGPFFVPAYGLWSAYLWMVGRDPYRDNPFEREAYGVADPSQGRRDIDRR